MKNVRKNRVLLVNDMPGYGTIALSAMIPLLNHMGYCTCNLPTALVSNTLGCGSFEILETTDYIKHTIQIWEQLGFEFDAISTGFFASEKQIRIISDFCEKQRRKKAVVFVNPVMGDDGRLYNGVSEGIADSMRQMLHIADYITPNYTEAAYLSKTPYLPEGLSRKGAEGMVASLAAMGAKSIVITSAIVDQKSCVIVYNGESRTISYLPFEQVPVSFPGTGDAFTALFTGSILRGNGIENSAKSAVDTVKRFIEINQSCGDKMGGIPIENCLEEIK